MYVLFSVCLFEFIGAVVLIRIGSPRPFVWLASVCNYEFTVLQLRVAVVVASGPHTRG